MIFCKGQEAVPWTRANRDVAEQDFPDLRPSVQDAEFFRSPPRCALQKKERSGLQSACDELIDKGAIHHSE
jgi:hypothetical protein